VQQSHLPPKTLWSHSQSSQWRASFRGAVDLMVHENGVYHGFDICKINELTKIQCELL
jgi:hypothetical protein